jgi:hypothetical protein
MIIADSKRLQKREGEAKGHTLEYDTIGQTDADAAEPVHL